MKPTPDRSHTSTAWPGKRTGIELIYISWKEKLRFAILIEYFRPEKTVWNSRKMKMPGFFAWPNRSIQTWQRTARRSLPLERTYTQKAVDGKNCSQNKLLKKTSSISMNNSYSIKKILLHRYSDVFTTHQRILTQRPQSSAIDSTQCCMKITICKFLSSIICLFSRILDSRQSHRISLNGLSPESLVSCTYKLCSDTNYWHVNRLVARDAEASGEGEEEPYVPEERHFKWQVEGGGRTNDERRALQEMAGLLWTAWKNWSAGHRLVAAALKRAIRPGLCSAPIAGSPRKLTSCLSQTAWSPYLHMPAMWSQDLKNTTG